MWECSVGASEESPEIENRAYSAQFVDLAFRPSANTERYRSVGDSIAMFDTSAKTTMKGHIYD